MKQITLLVLTALMLLSCSKENTAPPANPNNNQPQPTTNTDKAIGTWVWAYASSDIEYDWNGTGKSKDALQNCKKDNITILNTNGFANVDEGSDLCWLAPKTFQTSWGLDDSTFKFNSVYYKLQSITNDTLKFSELFITSTDRITINYVWGKKK